MAIVECDQDIYLEDMEDYQNFVSACKQPSADKIVDTDPIILKGWWAATQMSNEAGEVLELMEKAVRKGKEVDIEKVLDECGDTLWGLTCVLNTFGLSLDDCITHNVNKLTQREANEAAK